MSIQSKDSHVCQKSLPLDLETTLQTLFFYKLKLDFDKQMHV